MPSQYTRKETESVTSQSAAFAQKKSLRILTFQRAHNTGKFYCLHCQVIPIFFALEKCGGQKTWHWNLYGLKDNQEILFTRDHIIPKSKGGKDTLENSQMLCQPCNNKKGSKIL